MLCCTGLTVLQTLGVDFCVKEVNIPNSDETVELYLLDTSGSDTYSSVRHKYVRWLPLMMDGPLLEVDGVIIAAVFVWMRCLPAALSAELGIMTDSSHMTLTAVGRLFCRDCSVRRRQHTEFPQLLQVAQTVQGHPRHEASQGSPGGPQDRLAGSCEHCCNVADGC